jgi:putative ubiquitin-RnfH superfamily antitoxin RatB of RatAB toxin-antitoxin module
MTEVVRPLDADALEVRRSRVLESIDDVCAA